MSDNPLASVNVWVVQEAVDARGYGHRGERRFILALEPTPVAKACS
jgi:hypothetical protein